ncbi:MAG: nitrous oxide reductase family maturation protein NosD [Candidatus Odinarchaeota archaeon]
MKKRIKVRVKQIKIVLVGIFLILLCWSNMTMFFSFKDNYADIQASTDQYIPKLQDTDELILLHSYDFEDNVVGEDPFGTSLAVKEDPADGSVEVANLGDVQQNHVLMHKIERADGKRVWVRDNVSIYGNTFHAGVISFRIYKPDTSGFEVGIGTPNEEAIHIWFWHGQIIDRTRYWYVEGDDGYIADHPLNQWFELVIYFNLSRGWMLDIDDIRYGGDYEYGYIVEFTTDISVITYSSFASGGGSGYARFDDIAFYYYEEKPEISHIYIDDSDPNNDWDHALNQGWCTGSGTWNDPYIIEDLIVNAENSPTGEGIYILNSKNYYFIIQSCQIYNSHVGELKHAAIKLNNTNNGTIKNNKCFNNLGMGIFLINCKNNTILGNSILKNIGYGIWLFINCENNVISGNNITENSFSGIVIEEHCNGNLITGNVINKHRINGIQQWWFCNNNTISENIISANGRYGILVYYLCENNIISGNIISENKRDGIILDTFCNNTTISGNIISENEIKGIYFYRNCDNNTLSGNIITKNYDGVYLEDECDGNIILENLIGNNSNNGINILGTTCQYNLIYKNSLKYNGVSHASDSGTDNHWNNSIMGNYWDNHTYPDLDNDGIVDIPYIWIAGNADSKDFFPLVDDPLRISDNVYIDDLDPDNNWVHALNQGWCTGSGTWIDPYVIENLIINVYNSPTGSGIYINNSKSSYFIIENCRIFNPGIGTKDAAIKLVNTNNGALINNTCSNKVGKGISLTNSHNNHILRNTVNNNGIEGIRLDFSLNNIISENIVNENKFGILLYRCNNNTISKNIVAKNYNGIMLDQLDHENMILENIVNENDFYGIHLDSSNENVITGNTVMENAYFGINIHYACVNNIISDNMVNRNPISFKGKHNTASGNIMNECGFIMDDPDVKQLDSHNIDTTNLVNGKPLYYYVNELNLEPDDFTNAGQVILVNCNNSLISDVNISYSSVKYLFRFYGITLLYCTNNIISDNIVSNSYYGIYLSYKCKNNNISGNIANSNAYAIYLNEYCDNNYISGNNITNNDFGIHLKGNCNENDILANSINENIFYGIYFYNTCDNNNITENKISNTIHGMGISFNYGCDNNIISGNTLNENFYHGVYFTACSNNEISGNTINKNEKEGISFYSNCDNNTISGNILTNNSNGVTVDRNCMNNMILGNIVNKNTGYGLKLARNSNNNKILGNIVNNNTYGIYLYKSNRNEILGNSLNENKDFGIYLTNNCTNNNISGNNVNKNSYGIYLYEYCDNNIILGNFVDRYSGIYLNFHCYENNITGNTVINNYIGIHLNDECENNIISGNSVTVNISALNNYIAIYLSYDCNSNIILENIAKYHKYAICLDEYCDNNIILGNTVFRRDWGIYLSDNCNYNTISENIVSHFNYFGIGLINYCSNNIISGNTVTDNYDYGIRLYTDCDNNLISRNIVRDNHRGIIISGNCDYNNITENYIYYSSLYQYLIIIGAQCNSNEINGNVLVNYYADFISDKGTNTLIALNYYRTAIPSIFLEVVTQTFSTTEFVFTFKLSSECIGLRITVLSVQIWWNRIAVPPNDITELGNGLYNVSLTPIFVAPGENPILLNMTVSVACHLDKYFEMYIAVDPEAVSKGNTPAGSNVEVIDETTGVVITFSEVTSSGITTIEKSEEEPEPPSGFEVTGDYYEITTDASYSGLIALAIPYDETKVIGNEANLKILHWDPSTGWTDVTTGIDTVKDIIYGEITTLSIFVVMEEFEYIFQGYGALRVEGKWYRGESKLFISNDLIKIEIGDQSASWEITKHYVWRNYDYYYGKGPQGKISIIIHSGNDLSKAFAIGNGVLFYGTSTLVPPVSLNLNSLNLNDSRYVICFISILMGLIGLIYRKDKLFILINN